MQPEFANDETEIETEVEIDIVRATQLRKRLVTSLGERQLTLDGEWGQPMPVTNDAEDIQTLVLQDVASRRELGIERYGTALQPHNGRDALKDAYEEALDLTMYLKQQLVEDAEACTFETLWDEVGEWSEATFGTTSERGPIGPLNHLKRECGEAIAEIETGDHWKASVELADCLILIFDAARRYNMTASGLLFTALDKMETNRGRTMGEPDAEGVIEHLRSEGV